MSSNSADRLNMLYSELFVLLHQEEELRRKTEKKLEEARMAVDPRQEFNRWLKTNAGRIWKLKQFEYQHSKCAACHTSLRFEDAVVHHILSIKEFGSAANKPENFKLLHPGCNLKIGTRIVDFSS
jgi:5-methylcytosine-specific restriction endonuclease McrA